MIGHLIHMFRFYAGPTVDRAVDRVREDESGVTAIEYGLIAALIAVALIAGAFALGVSLNDLFEGISADVDNPSGAGAGS